MTPAKVDSPAAANDSFIRAARRKQLAWSAVEVITELGLERASMVKIAERAGVSRGVLAYHFADREDLLAAVVHEVYLLGGAELSQRVAAAATPRDALLTFVGGSVDFYAAYPTHIAALTQIFAAESSPQRAEHNRHRRELDDVAALLLAGQQEGQFRAFDTAVMAGVIRAILDVAIARLAGGSVDASDSVAVAGLREELVQTVDAATRVVDR